MATAAQQAAYAAATLATLRSNAGYTPTVSAPVTSTSSGRVVASAPTVSSTSGGSSYSQTANLVPTNPSNPSTPAKTISAPSGVTVTAPNTNQSMVTIYDAKGTQQTVPAIDVPFYQNQGWTTTNPIAPIDQAKAQTQGGLGYVYSGAQLTSKANNAAVNTLYNAYFGRQATADELRNWGDSGKTTVQQLEDFLRSERIKYGETKPIKSLGQIETEAANKLKMQQIEDYISKLDVPDEQKGILRQLAGDTFKTDQKIFDQNEINTMLKSAVDSATANLNPSFEKKTQQEVEDAKNKFADIRSQAALYAQNEGKSYKELLDKTKQSLRARGLTFSGASRKTLGGESAIGAQGVEGEIPQQRRFDYNAQQQIWNQKNRDLGIATERSIGSKGMEGAGLSGLQIVNPYAGNNIAYQTGRTGSQYDVKKVVGGTPQEGYIRSADGTAKGQAQFEGAGNYRFLSDTELARQAAIAKQTADNLAALTKKNSTL